MRIRTPLLALVLAAGAVIAAGRPAYAQQAPKKGETTAAARSRGAAAADENIKAQRAPNAHRAAVPAPASKGGERSRGSVSIVHLDNWTGYYIDLYVNGGFCATSGPWGDAYCYVPSGTVVVYGRAPFDDGTFLSWGPRTAYVDGTYDWKLTP